MIPSRKEMMDYWFEHPIAGTVIAFGMVEGIKTIWESLVNAKGDSPFSTYTNIRSGDALDDIGTGSLGHLTAKQKKELEEVTTGLKAASKMHAQQSKQLTKASGMHAEQARQLTAASKMHAGQAKTIEQLGSSSTTTSTSSAHGGTARTHAGSTWDKQRSPGERPDVWRSKEERFRTNGASFYASTHLYQLHYSRRPF